ncbi:MAG TPA: hypothetical protein VHE33_05245 [Acidobacteriaceae bacterium]|nr:hypothetical protein [Acidobacteriaceae bacterium]HWC00995.1 hypothetical protein [Bryobacteraceae bacterium]
MAVEKVQFFPRLKANCLARGDADFGSGARIPANSGFAGTDVENTEAAEFNPLTLCKSPLQALEDRIDSSLGLVALQAGAFDHLVNDVLLYQGFPPSGEVSVSTLIVETFDGIVNVAAVP